MIFRLFVPMNQNVFIRVIDISDFNLLKRIELDPSNKRYSDLKEELNEEVLHSFITSHHDIYLHKQLKFTILENSERVGFLDLYDVDFDKNNTGIGIFILPEFRRKQIAFSAILQGMNWCNNIGINHFLVEIEKSNTNSIHLFEKSGFSFRDQNENLCFLEKFF